VSRAGGNAMQSAVAVEVRGDLIIVTKPGTTFSATYGKSKDEPNVILLASTQGRDAERQALNQFRADAFIAATNKARELGWIV
jgi:hypothetical protein